MSRVTTITEFAEKIMTLFNFQKEQAIKAAGLVLSVIGFEDGMLDNTLDPDRRKILSLLSSYNIFYVDRQSVTLPIEQKPWRIVRWVFNRDALYAISAKKSEKREEEDIYANDDIWEAVDQELIVS